MKRILCPIDFTSTSLNGLEYAFELCHKFQGELILFHSIHPSPDQNLSSQDIFKKEEEAKKKLEKICEAHAQKKNSEGIKYWFLVRTGLAADVLLELIQENHIDLVVMGTKGADGIQAFLGTMSSKIAAKASCPVIIIPEEYFNKEISNIVYATDLKGNEDATLKYVIHLAQVLQAHISILNIQKKEPDNVKEIISQGENMLQLYQYPNMSFHVVEKSNIIEGINSFTGNHKADLMVMASSDKSLLQKIISPSQTRQMAFHSKVPFLVMHKAMI